MSAEELRRMRDAEYQGRRDRLLWHGSLGGRSGLAAPVGPGRTIGGVHPPSIGVVPEMGETVAFHMRGALALDLSDPYPVVRGGAPMLLIRATAEPSGAELDVLLNGTPVDTVTVVFTGGIMEYQVEQVYVRGDAYQLELTDTGTGGDGLVVATEFRPSLT